MVAVLYHHRPVIVLIFAGNCSNSRQAAVALINVSSSLSYSTLNVSRSQTSHLDPGQARTSNLTTKILIRFLAAGQLVLVPSQSQYPLSHHSQQGWRNPVNWFQVTPCMFKLGHFWSWGLFLFWTACCARKQSQHKFVQFLVLQDLSSFLLKMKIGTKFAYAIKI